MAGNTIEGKKKDLNLSEFAIHPAHESIHADYQYGRPEAPIRGRRGYVCEFNRLPGLSIDFDFRSLISYIAP